MTPSARSKTAPATSLASAVSVVDTEAPALVGCPEDVTVSCGLPPAPAEVAAVDRGGADLIHVDVMDGHFVPNITIGPLVARALKRVTRTPLDVHLMITDPDRYIDAFRDAGASMISVVMAPCPLSCRRAW